jgi:hypothetical protein
MAEIDYECPLPQRQRRELSPSRLAIGVAAGLALLAAYFVAAAMLGNF